LIFAFYQTIFACLPSHGFSKAGKPIADVKVAKGKHKPNEILTAGTGADQKPSIRNTA
jgi:hypothetical protein